MTTELEQMEDRLGLDHAAAAAKLASRRLPGPRAWR